MNHRLPPLLLAALATLTLPACIELYDDPAGFWRALIDGATAPFCLVARLFGDVEVYAADNTGWPYTLGFIVGAAATWGNGLVACARTLRTSSE